MTGKSLELFYLEPSSGGTRQRVCLPLVRFIEIWCNDVHPLKSIDPKLITDRVQVRQHFNRWCRQVWGDRSDRFDTTESIVPLTRQLSQRQSQDTVTTGTLRIASLPSPQAYATESFCQYLLAMSWRKPEDSLKRQRESSILRQHWMAFYMNRCTAVAWEIWNVTPQKMRSPSLFQEIVASGYFQISVCDDLVAKMLARFSPERPQLTRGLSHIKPYVDGQIKYSIFADLRKVLGDSNFRRTDLGLASRRTRSKIVQIFRDTKLPDAEIEEYTILWQCLKYYKEETGLKVNELERSDFQEIEQNYRNRSTNAIVFLQGTDGQTRLKEIGEIIRDFDLTKIISLEAEINESQSVADIIPDLKDLTPYDIDCETYKIIHIEITNICMSGNPSEAEDLSPQQLFWMSVGLGLNQTEIARIRVDNFETNDANQGSLNKLISKSCKKLSTQIHLALNSSSPAISKKEVTNSIKVLLKDYFDSVIMDYIFTSAGISYRVQELSVAEHERLTEMLTQWFQQYIGLCICPDLLQAKIIKVLQSFVYQLEMNLEFPKKKKMDLELPKNKKLDFVLHRSLDSKYLRSLQPPK
jgi:hypothetical protein